MRHVTTVTYQIRVVKGLIFLTLVQPHCFNQNGASLPVTSFTLWMQYGFDFGCYISVNGLSSFQLIDLSCELITTVLILSQ